MHALYTKKLVWVFFINVAISEQTLFQSLTVVDEVTLLRIITFRVLILMLYSF